MTTLNELKAQLEAKQAQAKAAMAEKIEMAKLQRELTLLESDSFQNALLEQQLREETTGKLTELEAICENIVETNPIRNARTRENRVWNPSRQYGLGNQIAQLTGLLSGIQYSARDHSSLMFAATQLSPDLVEATLDSFGSLPYYSVNNNMVVEGTAANLPQLLNNLALLEAQMGIQLDKSHLTEQSIKRRYDIAMAKALQAEAEHETTLLNQEFVIR